MTAVQDILDAIVAAGAADCWHLADEIATEHGITACRMCLVAKRLHPSVKQFTDLPAIAELFCEPCVRKYIEQRRIVQTVKIYARPRPVGDDANGDGSLARPYATMARAQRDIPMIIPSGYSYEIDITGLVDAVA